jgi:hypothetical protein
MKRLFLIGLLCVISGLIFAEGPTDAEIQQYAQNLGVPVSELKALIEKYNKLNPSQNIQHPNINRSIYNETTLFDLGLWEKRGPIGASVPEWGRFKATVLYSHQTGTSLNFSDTDKGTSMYFDIDRKWPGLRSGQEVIIYFAARRMNGYSSGREIIDIIY